MYCPSCGVQLTESLSYCNHCGAPLSPLPDQGKDKTVETAIDTLVWVIVGTTITFLGMALGALVLMKDGKIDERLGVPFIILSFLALVLVEGVLVWRLRQLNGSAAKTRTVAQTKELSSEQPGTVPAGALNEAREPVPSVTEQNTRPLEKQYREKAQR